MPSFINADLEIFSSQSLQPISEAWQDLACELYCGPDDKDGYIASFEVDSEDDFDDPIKLTNKFCNLIESLPAKSQQSWFEASKRIIDLGYRSDDKPNLIQCQIPLATSKRMIKLDVEIHISYYPSIDNYSEQIQ